MKLSQKQKLILAAVIFLISGFILFKTFSKPTVVEDNNLNNTTSSDNLSQSGENNPTQDFGVLDNEDIINLANQFEQMSNNVDLFTSPLFKNLKDFNTPLYSEDLGRANPFSLIGVDIASKNIIQSTSTPKTKTLSEL